MANIKLKDGSGIERTYSGVTKLSLPTAEGSTVIFSEGSGATEIDVFPLQTVSGFASSEDFMGLYAWSTTPALFSLEIGQTYFVEWDGTTYECVAQDASAMLGLSGAVGLGDLSEAGGTGNGEPFIAGYVQETDFVGFISFDTKTEHTIRIYQKLTPVKLQPLEVTTNGTYTAPEGTAYSQVDVEVEGSGATETDIFPLQTVEGFADEGLGAYTANSPVNFVINEGETYYVEWDGETYECEGIARTNSGMSIVYLGNGAPLGFEGNNEPFAIIYNVTLGTVGLLATDTATSHTIRVYQKSEPSVDIQPLDITENGLYTAPEGVAYSPITVNVSGIKETDIFPLQTVSGFDHSFMEIAHCTALESPPLFTLTAGETYIVEWNGEEYTCEAYEIPFNGAQVIYIGNGSALGHPGNEEPFCITYNITLNGTQFITTETDSEFTIRIYQKSKNNVRSTMGSFKTDEVAYIEIEGNMGDYEGYRWFTQSPSYSFLYYWETTTTEVLAVGEKWYVQDMGRDMVFTAFSMPLSSATGLGTCICVGNENIFDKDDTSTISYMIAYSPSTNKIAVFTRNKSKSQYGHLCRMSDAVYRKTIEHGLGTTPDLVIVFSNLATPDYPNTIVMEFVGFASKFKDKLPPYWLNHIAYAGGAMGTEYGIDETAAGAPFIYANETLFMMGGANWPFVPRTHYNWVAFAGLGE